jgi:hypothetical protein
MAVGIYEPRHYYLSGKIYRLGVRRYGPCPGFANGRDLSVLNNYYAFFNYLI